MEEEGFGVGGGDGGFYGARGVGFGLTRDNGFGLRGAGDLVGADEGRFQLPGGGDMRGMITHVEWEVGLGAWGRIFWANNEDRAFKLVRWKPADKRLDWIDCSWLGFV